MTIRLSTPVTGAILVTPTGATLHPTLAAARLAAPPGGRVYAITTTVGDLLAREAVTDSPEVPRGEP